MKPIFTPEDFNPTLSEAIRDHGYSVEHRIANIANAKIEKLLGPVISLRKCDGLWYGTQEKTITPPTHTARLFDIQPIKEEKPESCEHSPILTGLGQVYAKCRLCGRTVKAKWEEAE